MWVFPSPTCRGFSSADPRNGTRTRPGSTRCWSRGWACGAPCRLRPRSRFRSRPMRAAPFPARDLIIFLTFCVILVTLVFQGLTLPALIRMLRVDDDDGAEREEAKARSTRPRRDRADRRPRRRGLGPRRNRRPDAGPVRLPAASLRRALRRRRRRRARSSSRSATSACGARRSMPSARRSSTCATGA